MVSKDCKFNNFPSLLNLSTKFGMALASISFASASSIFSDDAKAASFSVSKTCSICCEEMGLFSPLLNHDATVSDKFAFLNFSTRPLKSSASEFSETRFLNAAATSCASTFPSLFVSVRNFLAILSKRFITTTPFHN